MQLRLHIVPADGEPYDSLFDSETLVIGRSSTSDLALADPFLSRHHARLSRDGEKTLVEDLGSRNGTFLNGQLVEEPTPTGPGDVIKLSGSIISIHAADDEPTDLDGPSTDLGATIFRPASELLLDSESSTRPAEVQGEKALRRYAERLKLLTDIHEALGRTPDLGELLELILERAFEHLRPEQGAIFLKKPDGEFQRAAIRHLPGIDEQLPLSRSLISEVSDKGLAALVLNVATDERFQASQSIVMSGVRSLVAAPFTDPDGGSLGLIVLSSKIAVRQFVEEDMELLVSLASVAAMKIRNAGLAEEAAQRRRIAEDLALARRIQRTAVLSERPGAIEGWEILGRNIASRDVSGDYFKILERGDGAETVLMVADVSGKGIAASLLTFQLEALCAAPIEDGLPPEEICTRVSSRMHERTPPNKYATAFIATLEHQSGVLRYANAGHTPGLLVRKSGEVEQLDASGLPLGLMPDGAFRSEEKTLEPGDMLLIYTDGINEAENPEEEQYGVDRLADFCSEHRGLSAEHLFDAIQGALAVFARGVAFADDQTMVVARRLD
jgi:sigma-B regulation protein RsbU (phosphoserine phosphatase)